MPKRSNSIETHPKRAEIERAIISRIPNLKIGKTYGVSEAAIRRHIQGTFARELVKAQKQYELTHGEFKLNYLVKIFDRLERMTRALEDWLEDPDRPGEYNVYARSTEIDVVYYVQTKQGRQIKKVAPLQQLLAMSDRKYAWDQAIDRGENNRRLMLDALKNQLNALLVLITAEKNARDVQSEEAVKKLWSAMQSTLAEYTDGKPENRRIIGEFFRLVDRRLTSDRQ